MSYLFSFFKDIIEKNNIIKINTDPIYYLNHKKIIEKSKIQKNS